MNIKINNEESIKKELMSMINDLYERMSFIEDAILTKNDDLDEDRENDSEDDVNDCDCCKLDNELNKRLITSMKRLREYDAQKYREYYNYLEEDDDILYELDVRYDEG